jgi:transposase
LIGQGQADFPNFLDTVEKLVQEQLFYEFRLDDWVPIDHLLRKSDAVLDLGSLRRTVAPFYSHTGRPSVDPELMIRTRLVGYCYGLPSRAALVRGDAPQSGVSMVLPIGARRRSPRSFHFFQEPARPLSRECSAPPPIQEFVARCMRAGLVGGEGFAIDASVIEADASSGCKVDGKLTTWPETERLTRAGAGVPRGA